MAKMDRPCMICGKDNEHLYKECIEKIARAIAGEIVSAERERIIDVIEAYDPDLAHALATKGFA